MDPCGSKGDGSAVQFRSWNARWRMNKEATKSDRDVDNWPSLARVCESVRMPGPFPGVVHVSFEHLN